MYLLGTRPPRITLSVTKTTAVLRIYQFVHEEAALKQQVSRSVAFDPEAVRTVDDILLRVRTEGDAAVLEFTERFQGIRLKEMRVPEAAIESAYASADRAFLDLLEEAFRNIREFHLHEAEKSFFYEQGKGAILGQRVTPMDRAMLYVPGGKAAYPSSVLMNAAPAQVAGVREIFMTTPCDAQGEVNPHILAAARVAGITNVYRLGGAQAVAAFAFGTESVPKVDMISGPGNKYVALAKKQVFGHVSIDSIAGPSEVVVIADDSADPEFIVMDMFAQAEHDPDASAVLITPSQALADAVQETAGRLVGGMLRREVIEKALAHNGAIVVVDSLEMACSVSDMIAPEHLELHVADPWGILPDLHHAGAIFMGAWSCETIGDYFAGPNHTLPTNGTARFFSPLSVRDFVKHTSIIAWSKEELRQKGEKIARFADHEGLQAHAGAVRARLGKL